MKKKFAAISILIMIAIFITGLIFIFKSVSLGKEAGYNTLMANGGSMDTQQYRDIINNNTASYRSAGIVLSLTGGLGILLSGYCLYKEL